MANAVCVGEGLVVLTPADDEWTSGGLAVQDQVDQVLGDRQ